MLLGLDTDTWALILTVVMMVGGAIAVAWRHALRVERGLTKVEGSIESLGERNSADHVGLRSSVKEQGDKLGHCEVKLGKIEERVETLCK